jgi:hypothetical protein
MSVDICSIVFDVRDEIVDVNCPSVSSEDKDIEFIMFTTVVSVKASFSDDTSVKLSVEFTGIIDVVAVDFC